MLDHPTSMYNLHQPEDEEEEIGIEGSESINKTSNPAQMSEGTAQAEREDICQEERNTGKDEDSGCISSTANCAAQGSLDLMQDSSDSEGEEEEQVTNTNSSYPYYENGSHEINQGVGKLSLHHPYYANTGAIPKNSASSIPSVNPIPNGKELVKVDVHATSTDFSNLQKWPTHNRYDPRNNRHYLYDVQEIEPNYADIAPSTDLDGRLRDSGCSEGSSQTEIVVTPNTSNGNLPSSQGLEHLNPIVVNQSQNYMKYSMNNDYSTNIHDSNKSNGYTSGAQQNKALPNNMVRSASSNFIHSHEQNQINHIPQQQYNQHDASHYHNVYHKAGVPPRDSTTYLDMDRLVL